MTTQTIELYNKLRATDPANFDAAQISKIVAQHVKDGKVKDPKFAETSFRLLHRVARSVDQNEWEQFTKDGQVPPLKLSAEEMELVRGGLVFSAVMAGIGVGLAIVGIYAAAKAL